MLHRSRSLRVAILVCLVACSGLLAMADQPYVAGEQQTSVDLPSGAWAIYPEGLGQNLVQTFTPQSNGWLGYLELPVGCGAGSLLNVKIREGLDGPILYDVNVSGLPEGVRTFQLIQVYDPAESAHGIKLHKNRQYAFQLAAFPNAAGVFCAIAKGPAADSYSRGAAYYEDVPVNGPGFLPLDNAADLPFVTLVR